MPGVLQAAPFKTIKVVELHPTFGAEIQGVDFSCISDESFSEILAALAKVASSVENWSIVQAASDKVISMAYVYSETPAWTTRPMYNFPGDSANSMT